MKKSITTIKDVAQKAGVSIATVSYSLNNRPGVSSKKRKQIQKIAKELGYVPNTLATGLLLKKTDVIGLITPDITNVYLVETIKYLERFAKEAGLFLLIGATGEDFDQERNLIKRFISKSVDTFIIMPSNYYTESDYISIVSSIQRRKIPIVFFNFVFPMLKTNYVSVDLEEGQYTLTRHVLEQGIRNTVLVSSGRDKHYTKKRYNGYSRALQEYGIKITEDAFFKCGKDLTFRDGYEAFIKYYNKNRKLPEAFFGANDPVAYGIYKGLKEKGFNVPEDVSLTGFDDISLPTLDSLALTTMKIPIEDMCRLCIEVIQLCYSDRSLLRQYVVQPELVVRNSVLSK